MSRSKKWLRGYQCALVGLFAVAGMGCSPQLLWFLNRGDDKTPAQYPLEGKDGKKEYSVAIIATANPAILNFPDFSGIDRDLAATMGTMLATETIKDKHKVKVIDQSKVNELRNKNPLNWDIANRSQLAKDLGADHLIEIDISQFNLYGRDTGREAFHGKATVNVKVYDATGNGSAKIEYSHTAEPPLRPTDTMTAQGYKQFLSKQLAKELMNKHVPHTADRDMPSQIR